MKKIILPLLMLPCVTFAQEVNLILTGVVDSGSVEDLGKTVAIQVRYDSDNPARGEYSPHFYAMDPRQSDLRVTFDGKSFSSPPQMMEWLMATLDNRPDLKRLTLEASAGLFAPDGSPLNGLIIEAIPSQLPDVGLPASPAVFQKMFEGQDLGSIRFVADGRHILAKITGGFDAGVFACDRQVTYAIDTNLPGELSQVELTLTPATTKDAFMDREDSGYSSGFHFMINGHQVKSGIFDGQPGILTHYMPGSKIATFVGIVLQDQAWIGDMDMTLDLDQPEGPVDQRFPDIIQSQSGHLNIRVNGQTHAGLVTDVRAIKGGCKVLTVIVPNPQNDWYWSPLGERQIHIPSDGGYAMIDLSFKNVMPSTYKFRRWTAVEMPNGIEVPMGKLGNLSLSAGQTYADTVTRIAFPKAWPNGEYKVKVYLVSNDGKAEPMSYSIPVLKGQLF